MIYFIILLFRFFSIFIAAAHLKSVWILDKVHYMSIFLHPAFERFQIAPHEKQKAIDLIKSEILKRQSCSSDGSSDINITYCSLTKKVTTSFTNHAKSSCTMF